MLIFLYGSDNYRASQKLKEIISQYQQKHGGFLSFEKFDLKEKGALEKMERFFESQGMFSDKKLAVLESLFQSSQLKDFEKFLKKSNLLLSEDSFLIIFEGELEDLKDEKKKLFNWLKKKPVLSQEFKNFKNFREAKIWLKKEIAKFDIEIEDEALEMLFNSFGADSWRLINELRKISLYQPDRKVTKADVLKISVLEAQPNIFKIFDAFFEQNKKKTLFCFKEALKSGLDAGLIFNLLIGQLRAAILLVLGQANEVEAHPFVVRKIKSQLWRFKKEKLLKFYEELAAIDLAVKTGKIDYESGLERLLINF